MKLLLVKTSSMGDVIHSFPAVTDALRAVPGLTLDWCVEEPFAELVALHPGVGTIHKVAMRRWRKTPLSPATWAAVRTVARAMKAERYDLVLDAQGLMKSLFLAKLAKAPIAGFDRGSVREPLAALGYARTYAVPRDLHAIARTRLLFGAALGYTPDLGRLDNGIVPPTAKTAPHGAATAILLHGTSRDDKKWPLPSWIETAAALAARGITPVTTWSNPAERSVAEAIAAAVPQTVVLPKSPLAMVAAEIGRSSLVVGVDTGLTHLASAFGLPTVAIFLASEPGLTGPMGPRSVSLSAERNTAGVTPAAVLEACLERMAAR
jgi:heptosyltransferase-1